jgi:hypothetical protein
VTKGQPHGNVLGVKVAGKVLLFVLAALVVASSAAAEGTMHDVHDGIALRGRKPPDVDGARAAFERAAGSADSEAAASGLYFLGEMDEDAMLFEAAVAHYDASLARLPSSRYAQRAAARSSTLKAHAEGGFAPLVRLETVRRDPRLANDAASLRALTEEANHFPPGPVRVEARLLAAEAYRGRLHRPDEEIALLWLVVRDPGADVIASREAAVDIIDAEIARGDVEAAERARAELGTKLDAPSAAKVTRLLRRHVADVFAKIDLSLVIGLFALALARGNAKMAAKSLLSILPLSIAFSAFAGVAGGLLASSYETGNATPFVVLVPLMLAAILVARAWGAVGSRAVPARIVRSVLCSAALFSLALLFMERMTPQYLEGFGL